MDNHYNIKKLLHKYFKNECSQSELRMIYNWLSDPENQVQFNQVLDQYLKDENTDVPNHITRINSWKSIASKIAEEQKFEMVHKHHTHWWSIGRVAGVVLLLIIGSVVMINQDKLFIEESVPEEELVAIVKQTEKGQKRRIHLPDGSWVTLNSASSIEISPDFMQGINRTVYLRGEAFFEVEKIAGRPFFVKTEKVLTQVLGTSFNVAAYPSDNVKVAVSSGKVQVSTNDLSLDLVPDEMAVFKEQEGILKTKFDPMLEFGWKDGYLVFNQADFTTLINKLELWYGVNITLNGDRPGDTFTASYHNVSLENVLEGLSFSGDFSYQLEDKNLIIEIK